MTARAKRTALYLRVSSGQQSLDVQRDRLAAWAKANKGAGPFARFEDTAPGRSMDRPGWRRLEREISAGAVKGIVVVRLDRLGRTAAGLSKLFRDLAGLGIPLISLSENVDLSTPAGRLIGDVIGSVAEYENELRGERIRAGQARARARGKRWGGSRRGRRTRRTLSAGQDDTVFALAANGIPKAEIARRLSISRPTVYAALKRRAPNLFDKAAQSA